MNDDSAERPRGNRRVKPSSEIMPLAFDYESADFLISSWEGLYGDATRFCDIRIPVDGLSSHCAHFADALTHNGYRIEAIMPNLFTIDGVEHTVADFAKNSPERTGEFTQRVMLIPRVFHDVLWNDDVRRLSAAELESLRSRLEESFQIRRANSVDAHDIVNLMRSTFPAYGTFSLEETIPLLVCEGSGSMLYVSRKRHGGELAGVCAVDIKPFGFGELTDVAVSHEVGGNGNGLGTGMCYAALVEARESYGVRHFISDDVPHPAMNKISKKLGGRYCGLHENQVRIITYQLHAALGSIPDSMDLIVCSGSTDFR